MKFKLFALMFVLSLFVSKTINAQSVVNEPSISLCESYSDYGDPKGIASAWDIKPTGGYVYILYSNGEKKINSKKSLLLYVDKKNKAGKYEVYATETFKVESGAKFSVYDYKFTEAGSYKIQAYQDGKVLATTYATINVKGQTTSSSTTTKTNNQKSSGASIVTCSDYDENGKPSGIYSIWNITEEAHIIPILFTTGGKAINTNNTLWLYVDKKDEKGNYIPYGTEKFDVKAGNNWVVYNFSFDDPGEYKISAMQLSNELATTNITVKTKNETTLNKSKKSIVTCTDFDTYGKPSGIYKEWNIQKSGSYVYVLFDNGGQKINGTLWLYVDKENENGAYVAFDTKTFENTNNKTWANYKYTFTKPGNYKISAVSSKGEEAAVNVKVNFADNIVVDAKKSIDLVDSYDDYGKPFGINDSWLIENNGKGGYVYVLFDNGEKMTGTYSLFVDKKNTSGQYVEFDTKILDNTGKNWSVYDYHFKEPGEYKISAAKDNKEIVSTYATISYKKTETKPEAPKYQDNVTTAYYNGSEVLFGESATTSGTVTGQNTLFTLASNNTKTLKMVFKQAKAIKTNKIYVDIYSGNDYSNFVETKEITTLPTQQTFQLSYTFKQAGKYRFSIYNADEIFMNLGEVAINAPSTSNQTYTSQTNTNSNTTNNSNSIYNSLTFNNKVSKENRTALVIGNGNYINAGKLPNPVHDAEEMAKTLKACGFNVTLIINANKKQMNEAVQQFGMDIANKKGTGLVFYAGHGVQAKGENYLIPTDANLYGEEDLQYECVNVGQLLAKMDVAKNDMNILLLDACRNNPFERSWTRSQNGGGLASLNAPYGTIIGYSTNPGNVASDGTGYNSPYTTALLKFLNKPSLTIEQVLKGVAYDVKNETPGQFPWYSSSITGEFYFRP